MCGIYDSSSQYCAIPIWIWHFCLIKQYLYRFFGQRCTYLPMSDSVRYCQKHTRWPSIGGAETPWDPDFGFTLSLVGLQQLGVPCWGPLDLGPLKGIEKHPSHKQPFHMYVCLKILPIFISFLSPPSTHISMATTSHSFLTIFYACQHLQWLEKFLNWNLSPPP